MNEDLYSEETRKFMSEEKKASIKAEVFSWVKVIVSAIIIALLVDFFIIGNNDPCRIQDHGTSIVLRF